MASRAIPSKFLWRTVISKPPTVPFGIVACTFSDNLFRNSCMHKHQHSNESYPRSGNPLTYYIIDLFFLRMSRHGAFFLFHVNARIHEILNNNSFRNIYQYIVSQKLNPLDGEWYWVGWKWDLTSSSAAISNITYSCSKTFTQKPFQKIFPFE